jgi:hypothetical protein
MPLDLSRSARRSIRLHGGCVYVWTTPLTAGYSRLHTATARPSDVEFACRFEGDVEVCLDRELAGDDVFVRIERRVLPPWGIAVRRAQMSAALRSPGRSRSIAGLDRDPAGSSTPILRG